MDYLDFSYWSLVFSGSLSSHLIGAITRQSLKKGIITCICVPRNCHYFSILGLERWRVRLYVFIKISDKTERVKRMLWYAFSLKASNSQATEKKPILNVRQASSSFGLFRLGLY